METDPPGDPTSYAGLSPRGLLRRAAASASTYTFGVFGVRAIEFLLLPLYWALLPPREYGILAVAAVVTEFLRAVFGFGLPEAVTRFYHDWPEDRRGRHVGALWTGAWGGSIVLAVLLILAGPRLLAPVITQVPWDPYLRLAVLVALGASLVQLPLMVLRIMEKARLYVAGTAFTTLLSAGLAIWFIAGLDRGAAGVLEAQALAYGISAVVYGAVLLRWARPTLDLAPVRAVLGFALPLIPSKLIEAAATVVDRFLLEKMVSLETLGIYHAARQVGRAVEMLGYSLLTAWIPFQMRVLAEREHDGRRVIADIAPWFLFAVLVASVGLSVLGPDLIRVLGLDDYRGVIPLIPIAVLPGAILSMAHVVIQGYIIARKTQYAWIRSGSRLVTVVLAMLVLLPLWGVWGAFIALALAALVQGMVGYALSQRFFPIPFRWGRVGVMTAGAVGVVVAAGWVDGVLMVDGGAPLLDLSTGVLLVGLYAIAAGRVLPRPARRGQPWILVPWRPLHVGRVRRIPSPVVCTVVSPDSMTRAP